MLRTLMFAALILGASALASALPAPQSPQTDARSAALRPDALGAALAAIDQCITRLDAEVDVGYRRIALRCPSLAAALEQGGLARWLPQDWRSPDNDLSAGGLEELRGLLASELTMRPVSRPPSIRALRQVLAGLASPARTGTLWDELEHWWRRIGREREPSAIPGHPGMLSGVDLAPKLTRLLTLAALVGLLGFAAVVLLNELRAAGMLHIRPQRRGARAAVRLALVSRAAEPEEVSITERPRLLLALVLERLGTRGVTGLGSLTARELIRAVQLEDPAAAGHLERLILTAERVRYAAMPASADDCAAAVRGGNALLERLAA
ncbi:MAG TPA: DUF4129 domain-containing protein [Steroidobacteraceae bacterium]|nr:DUF4129 domain-containing protein [Steroidobacteraceae bacterium]